jgi:hypothetical protein
MIATKPTTARFCRTGAAVCAFLAAVSATTVPAAAAPADAPATKPARPRRGEIVVLARVAEGAEERRGGAARQPGADKDLYAVILAPRVRGNGATALARPTLFWSLSKQTRFSIQVTVNRLGRGNDKETVFDKTLRGPHQPGVRKLDLAAEVDDAGRQATLEPGVRYEVTVAVLVRADEASANPDAVARIERLPLAGSGPLADAAASASADPYERARTSAAAGAWLDALAALTAGIDANPNDAELKDARVTLLRAQGLTEEPGGRVVIDAAKPRAKG